MFSMADIAQFESIYGVDIIVDNGCHRIEVKGSADLLKQCRAHIIGQVPVGLAIEFVETVSAGRGTTKQINKPMNFTGLWRSAEGEQKCLLRVVEWQMGSSYEYNHDELRIKAQVVRMDEGSMYPKLLELMMPKRSGVVMEVESWWYPTTDKLPGGYPTVELSGKVYGPPPLSREWVYAPQQEPNHAHMGISNMPLLKEWDGSKWGGSMLPGELPSVDWKKELFDISQPPAMLSGMEQIRADLIKSFVIPDLNTLAGMDRFIGNDPLGLPYSPPDKKPDKDNK